MRKLLISGAIMLSLAPGVANAAQPPCLTPNEFTSLATYSLPSIITGTSQRCAATLPQDAFLKRNGAELATRYAARKPAAWPGAKAAFIKLGAGTGNAEANDLLRTLPDPTLQQLVDGMVQGLVGQRLPASRCGSVDRLVSLLAPLPPENTAELIGLAVGLGARAGETKVGNIALCAA